MKSPDTIPTGAEPEAMSIFPNPRLPVGGVTSKKATLETPPPGAGLDTVTEAVPGAAISAALRAAVSCPLLTKFVVLALPFQFTTDPETKPAPFTVRVNAEPPGGTAVGLNGWLR